MDLPRRFCWTRFGTEAGESINRIFSRKEREREANDGVFLWGIGNAIGPSMRELVRCDPNPKVLFSPIKSSPKLQDVYPETTVAWTSGEALDGTPFYLPEHSLVRSRYSPATSKRGHYALVCFTERALLPSQNEGQIVFNKLQNLLSGRPVGVSQVTAVVQTCEAVEPVGRSYDVTVRAQLVYPYLVRLRCPRILAEEYT